MIQKMALYLLILAVVSMVSGGITGTAPMVFVIIGGVPPAFGMGVYHFAKKIKTDSKRNIFFILSCALPLSVIAAGAAVMAYAQNLTGWDSFGYGLLGLMVLIIGIGSKIVVKLIHYIKTLK